MRSRTPPPTAWGFDYSNTTGAPTIPTWKASAAAVPHVPAIDAITDDKLLKLMIPTVMRSALDRQKRDIYFSMCQYAWQRQRVGAQVGGNSWRTTGDITDNWGSMPASASTRAAWKNMPSPAIGMIRTCSSSAMSLGPGAASHQTHPNEQYTHIALWSLLASPL